MAGAAYQFDLTFDEGETFGFTCPWSMKDGSPFPWADYTIEYALSRGPCSVLPLTSESGISVDPDDGTATFYSPDTKLRCGAYIHACRVKHIASGDTIAVFAGTVTVNESPFR
jgi:hypothetical protein